MYRGLDMPGNFFERFTRRKERYVLAMQAVLGERFENGDGIYCGLAGQFLFHGLCNVFKVRVVAPMEYRTTAAMSDLGLSYDEAVRFLGETDERRAKGGHGFEFQEPDQFPQRIRGCGDDCNAHARSED